MAKRAQKKARGKRELTLQERLHKALQNPLRTKLLALMNDREWSPREFSVELNEGLSQISYHIKVLHDYELIELTRTEPRRGAVEHFYRALHRAYIPPSLAKQIPKSGRGIIVADILEEIDKDVSASIQSGRFFARDDDHASWTPADLDEIGCGEANELADEYVERFLEIHAKSATRRVNGESHEHIAISSALLLFGSERGEKQKAPSRKPDKRKSK